MSKKRKLKPAIKYCIYALIGILIVTFVLSILPKKFDGVSSKNTNAVSLDSGNCLIFYEKGMDKYAKNILNDLCDPNVEDEQIFDYTLTKYGKYSYLNYGKIDILVDEKMQIPSVKTITSKDAMMIISDYLRYAMKSQKLDYAYSLSFLEESYYDKLNAEMFDASIIGDDLHLHFKEYDVDADIPLIYIGKYIGIDLGSNERYIKPHFVDPHRKMICLTFDDGPSNEVTPRIVDELYKYDATATFFVLGARLEESKNATIAKTIEKANEIGSHTTNNNSLTQFKDAKDILAEVNGPVNYLKQNFNYQINTYRPPYGAYDELVDKTVPYAAVLWTVDSNDYLYDDPKPIAKNILDYVYDGCIVYMNDIYVASADALVKEVVIKELVSQGYQLVTVSEYANAKEITLKQGMHLGWD